MLSFHDMFCGAGGSTLGALMAGATPTVGLNHWPIACESYEANHASAGAQTACVDVVTQDPRRYPKAEMLLASPECTHHSYARGKVKDDPSLFDPDGDMGAERSRATMWDVVRFAEVHAYRAVIVENVEAAVKWGMPRGRKFKQGEYGPLFAAWLQAMEALDYRWKLVHLNSMVCGVPQSRDRLYVVFWKRGQREPDLRIPALAYCFKCAAVVMGEQRMKQHDATIAMLGQQYTYVCPTCEAPCAVAVRPSAHAIDWSLTAPIIGEREAHGMQPLRPATLERIRRGLVRLRDRPATLRLPDGLVVQVGGNTFERTASYARAWPTDQPMPTVTQTADRGLVLSNMTHNVPRLAADEPSATVTSGGKLALVYAGRESAIPRRADDEVMHALTSINSLYVVEPNPETMVVEQRGDPFRPGGGNQARVAESEPIGTVSAQGTHHAVVVANYGSAGAREGKSGWSRHVDDGALGTITTQDHHALFTYRAGQHMQGVDEPMRTVSTVEQQALVGEVTQAEVDGCTFRMLQPHELKRASGFTDGYVLHGNKREQVAQVGNAVTAPAEAELVGRVMLSLDEGS